MTIRTCLAKPIRALWFGSAALVACLALWPAAPATAQTRKRPAAKKAPARTAPTRPGGSDLASLVQAYRESPTAARRSAVEAYAAAHVKDGGAALARLALGVTAFEQKNYAEAIVEFKPVQAALPRLADYTAYYLAAARVELNEASVTATVAAKDLAPAHSSKAPSPLSGKAWLVEARALKTSDAAGASRLLRDHYAELPQPDGDLALGECYQAANDLRNAADFYQRVYSRYVNGEAANRSAAALLALKDTMGAAFPPPLPEQALQRADRLLELREYAAAKSAYEALLDQLASVHHDQARVRLGAADFLHGQTSIAYGYLRGLEVADSDAAAERLYYIEECARHLNNEEAMMAAIRDLADKYPQSPWRLKALVAVANRYLLVNRPDDYVPLYKAAYESFPAAPVAALCHWKVTFHEYLRGAGNADELLAEHLRDYASHFTAGAALYFLGRSFERQQDPAAARAAYQLLAQTFENTYYAMLSRDRLRSPEIERAAKAAPAAQWLRNLKFSGASPVPAEGSPATAARIERSRMLRAAGLADLADAELRFGARTDGQPPLLAMESATSAEAPHRAMRIMKTMTPDYLGVPLPGAPRKFWELLFPLPYRTDLVQSARQCQLDPYLLAGLIRQESEFNPQAISPARAYGLTQVRAATGRQYARQAGVPRFTTSSLYQPAINLRIGSTILRGMLNHNNGKIEQTLAAYNAGPARVAEWLTWNTYREPAEFVESIPFTETRDYVQAVLRNAEMYRRLYEGASKASQQPPKPAM